MDFKYKEQINSLLSYGVTLPELIEPNDKLCYRFIFKDNLEKNHITAYLINPQRALTDLRKSKASTSGYALSCFEDENKAKERFASLSASIPMIRKTIGDSLSSGTLTNSDGLISKSDRHTTHFDLYEYCECNLSVTFKYQYKL